MTTVKSLPVNSRGNEYVAQLESKAGRELKETDILVFFKIGKTTITGKDGNLLKGGLFKNSSSGFFNNLFKYKARKDDVIAIFKTAGMTPADAETAFNEVKQISKERGISGLSATAVRTRVEKIASSEKHGEISGGAD